MLSIPHLIVIFVIALVIFGPEKLPELARNAGKLMAEFRRATSDIRGTFETHLRDLEREANDRRIDSVSPARSSDAQGSYAQSAANAAAAQNPQITAAEGTVPANAPHEATVAAAQSAAPAAGQPLGTPASEASGVDQHTMFPEDPEEFIRQTEAQIARERAGEFENPERVSDGAIGKP
ncbi:MAG TPA: twin-arginine translocase TatA/TatE family subunit [Terracidiphilus sp.]